MILSKTSLSTNVILLGIPPLSLKYGLISLQNVLLSEIFFSFKFLKKFGFFILNRFIQKLCYRLYLHQSSYDLSLLKLFFSCVRSIIFFLSSLDMKELLLCLNIFVFSGACLSKISRKVFSKTPYVLLSFILSRFILRVSLKVSILKFLFYK